MCAFVWFLWFYRKMLVLNDNIWLMRWHMQHKHWTHYWSFVTHWILVEWFAVTPNHVTIAMIFEHLLDDPSIVTMLVIREPKFNQKQHRFNFSIQSDSDQRKYKKHGNEAANGTNGGDKCHLSPRQHWTTPQNDECPEINSHCSERHQHATKFGFTGKRKIKHSFEFEVNKLSLRFLHWRKCTWSHNNKLRLAHL